MINTLRRLALGAVTLAIGMCIAEAAIIDITTASLTVGQVNRWTRDNIYRMNGYVYVTDGTTLEIEAGTVIWGKEGATDVNGNVTVPYGTLFICQGGRLLAEGTAQSPIIFTFDGDDVLDPLDSPLTQRGKWGGLVVLGRAPINSAVDAAGNGATPKYEVYEGLPETQVNGQQVHRFGGAEVADDSGVIRYVSIRHGGSALAPNKEINGLSLGGVGSGTTIEYVEAYATADDGFEFFGGTVNTRYLVSAFNDDDSFDTDMGYSGKNQFWFGIQAPDRRDALGEHDGDLALLAAPLTPKSVWTVRNYTGLGAGMASTGGKGLTIREYGSPNYVNAVFAEIKGVGLTVDGLSDDLLGSDWQLESTLWWNVANNANTVDAVTGSTAGAPNAARTLFTTAAWKNAVQDPQLRGVSYVADGGLDPRPLPGSPALDPANIKAAGDVFFQNVAFIGALADRNWIADWTALGAYNVITAKGGRRAESLVLVTHPTIVFVVAGSDLHMSVATQNGRSYQLQSATLLTGQPGDWSNEGAAVAGDGTTKSFDQTIGAAGDRYFRIQVN